MAALSLYHVERTDAYGYDSYSDFVVCAESEQEAQETHPGANLYWNAESQNWRRESRNGPETFVGDTWTDKMTNVRVKLLGTALPTQKKGVICASFHAG